MLIAVCMCAAVAVLQDAVVKGWFRTSRDPTEGGTHLRVVVLTAYEVASAMSYIHSHGIAHLVSWRVGMLQTQCRHACLFSWACLLCCVRCCRRPSVSCCRQLFWFVDVACC
jgi:hypothetical protein